MPLIPVELSDGEIVNIEYIPIGGQPKSILGNKKFGNFLKKVSGLVNDIQQSIKEVKPDKMIIEVGVDVAIEGGELTAIFVKGNSKANFKVTLEWNHEKPNEIKSTKND